MTRGTTRDAGQRKRKRETRSSSLQLSWVERPRFIRLMKRLLGRKYLKWSVVKQDAQALREKGRTRAVTWPPISAQLLKEHSGRAVPDAITKYDPASWHVAMALPCIQEHLGTFAAVAIGSGVELESGGLAVEAATKLYPGVLLWRADSQRVFNVHWRLFEDLAHAERPTIEGYKLSFPFRTFYIEFPRGVTMADPIAPSSRLNVAGALVSVDATTARDYDRRELRLALIGEPDPERWPAHADPVLTCSVLLDAMPLNRVRVISAGALDHVHVPRSFKEFAAAGTDPAHAKRGDRAQNDIVTIVIWLVDYIMERDDDVQHQRERATAVRRSRRGATMASSRQRYFTSYLIVGRKHAKSNLAGGGLRGQPMKFSSRVRAHYRWQAVGPGYRDHKRVLIEAHTRRGTHGAMKATRVSVRKSKR